MADAIGVNHTTVRAWFNMHYKVPDRYDVRIIDAAQKAGRIVTPHDLFDIRNELGAIKAEKAEAERLAREAEEAEANKELPEPHT